MPLFCRALAVVLAVGSLAFAGYAGHRLTRDKDSAWAGVLITWLPAVGLPAMRAAGVRFDRRDAWGTRFAGRNVWVVWTAALVPAAGLLGLAAWAGASADPPGVTRFVRAAGPVAVGWWFAALALSAAGLALDRPPHRHAVAERDDE